MTPPVWSLLEFCGSFSDRINKMPLDNFEWLYLGSVFFEGGASWAQHHATEMGRPRRLDLRVQGKGQCVVVVSLLKLMLWSGSRR